jgi:hypothetical protein
MQCIFEPYNVTSFEVSKLARFIYYCAGIVCHIHLMFCVLIGHNKTQSVSEICVFLYLGIVWDVLF